MPILGLVLPLEDAELVTQGRVGEALRGAADLEAGEPAAHRWPVVLETATGAQAEARVKALGELSGVAGVDVGYADFEDLLARSTHSSAREER